MVNHTFVLFLRTAFVFESNFGIASDISTLCNFVPVPSVSTLTLARSSANHSSRSFYRCAQAFGTATVRDGRFGDRIPVGGRDLSCRPARPRFSPNFLYNEYRVFLELKQANRDADHPPPFMTQLRMS